MNYLGMTGLSAMSGMSGISTGVANVDAAWDAFERGAAWTPSSSDTVMTMSGSASWSSIKAFPAKSSGKWYCEIKPTTVASSSGMIFGFIQSAKQGMTNYLGAISKSCGFRSGGSSVFSIGAGVATSWATSYTIAANDVVMLALDATAGKGWIGKNGTWLGSGDPANGTNPAMTFTAGETWTFAASALTTGYVFNIQTQNVSHSPPSGFSLLDQQYPYSRYLFAAGDSISAGTGTTAYPTQTISAIPTWRGHNFAAGGSTIGVMANTAAIYDTWALNETNRKSIVTIMGGYNDWVNNGRTEAQVIADLQAFGTARKAAGHGKVVVCTLTTASNAGFNAARATINAAIRLMVPTYYDLVIDFDNTEMGLDANATNPTYLADPVHPTQAGQDVLFNYYYPRIAAL